MTDTLKEWVSPTDEKGFMRTLLCPVLDSPMYKKLRQCSQLKKVVYTVAILGFMACMESFFAKPWWNQVQGYVRNKCNFVVYLNKYMHDATAGASDDDDDDDAYICFSDRC